MSIRLRDAGNTLRGPAKGFKVRDAGNVLRTIKTGRIRDAGNVSRIFYQQVSLVLSPGSSADYHVVKYTTIYTGKTVSKQHFISVLTGVPPYTYAWTFLSGDFDVEIDDPAIADPTFSVLMAPGTIFPTAFKCLVTDATGATAEALVILRFELIYASGGGGEVPEE